MFWFSMFGFVRKNVKTLGGVHLTHLKLARGVVDIESWALTSLVYGRLILLLR